jgi:hypothetical protein
MSSGNLYVSVFSPLKKLEPIPYLRISIWPRSMFPYNRPIDKDDKEGHKYEENQLIEYAYENSFDSRTFPINKKTGFFSSIWRTLKDSKCH